MYFYNPLKGLTAETFMLTMELATPLASSSPIPKLSIIPFEVESLANNSIGKADSSS
jgi:hypothetical protein